jgi:predicted ArsR family transcriptional regulator
MIDIWKDRRERVLQLLEKEVLRSIDIATKMKLSETTLFELLIRMEKDHLVKSCNQHNGKKGRPKVYWMRSENNAIKID